MIEGSCRGAIGRGDVRGGSRGSQFERVGRGGQFEGRELFEARGGEFEDRGGQFEGRGGGQFEGGGRRFQEVHGRGIGIKDKPLSYRRVSQHHTTSDSEFNPRRVGGNYGRAGIGEGGGEEKEESTDNFDVVRGFKFH